MAMEGIVDADLISQLPEPILHHILSFLPVKDAARASILSKKWNCIWNTLPYLDFCKDFLSRYFHYFPEKDDLDRSERKLRKKNKYLLKVTSKIILSRCQHANVQKLRLWIPEHEISRERRELEHTSSSHLSFKLERLMLGVAKSGLRDLELRIFHNEKYYHNLPSAIVLAKSINAISLYGFNLMSLSSVDIKFSSLRSLILSGVYLEDHIMKKLISGCPLLETFQLYFFRGLETIYATGLRELKQLESQGDPDLKMFKLDVATCASLRKIKLFSRSITGNLLHQLVSECLFVEDLTIGCSEALENIKISTYKLKRLGLFLLDKLVKAEINAPNLEKFCFTTSEILPTFLLNVSDALEVYLQLSSGASEDLSHDQLINFLGYFSHFRIVKVIGISDEIIIPYEKRDRFLSPLCGTGHLQLSYWGKMKKSLVVELLEYMLWLSPRAETLTMTSLTYGKKGGIVSMVLKFLYEKNDCEDSSSPCCEFPSGECWRHSLAEVRIERFDGDEDDRTNMMNFFQQLGENPKIVEPSSKCDSFYDGLLYSSYDELFSDE